MAQEDDTKKDPPFPADENPSLYTFSEYSAVCAPASSSNGVAPPPKGTSFRNIHCVGLNCFNCVWDASIPPLLTVDPGEICTVECLDASGGQIDPRTSTAEDIKSFELSRVNPLHGPIYINGAEPGDTLEVEIVKLQTGSWGWTGCIPGFGLLSGDDPELDDPELKETAFLQIWRLDGGNGYTEMTFDKDSPAKPYSIRIPIHPFCGEMGVAPKRPGPHSQVPPDDHGGNVDCKHLVEGSKVYFPIFQKGALFSIGDGHAAQGEGEVCGTAIECPMKVDVRFKILKDKKVEQMEYLTPGPLDRYTNTGQWVSGFERSVGLALLLLS
jgi:acetamidase/formamidase